MCKFLAHILQYILVKLWIILIKKISLEKATNFSAKLFQLIGMHLKATNIARKNLRMVMPELNEEDTILQMWDNLGRVAAELPIFSSMSDQELSKYISFEGLEKIEALRGKRAIFCSAHLANWELLSKVLSMHNIKCYVVYRAANNKLVDKLINNMRENDNIILIPKSRKAIKQIMKAMEDNSKLGMLLDQKMKNGIKVKFMGHDAMTAPAIANLAKNYNCPIIPVQIIRKKNSISNSLFKIVIHPEIPHIDRNVEDIMLDINNHIGEWVKEEPSQWFWLHNRWSHGS